MNSTELLKSIIEGYRFSVQERYQYSTIKDKYSIPLSINEATVDQLRSYFLEYMYPNFDRRLELDEAFRSLDDYIRNPEKLFSLLMDAGRLIWKFGRHLPKILSAGLKALKSFRAVAGFEEQLVEEAIRNHVQAPFDPIKLDALIQLLPRQEVEKFITLSESLFETLHDKAQVEKIIEIIHFLIQVMKRKPGTYTKSQVRGLEIGLELITEGNRLFHTLSEEDQQKLIALITTIERDHLGYTS